MLGGSAGRLLVVLALVGMGGCDGDPSELIVDLRTDFLPGTEFTGVVIEVGGQTVERVAMRSQHFVGGQRVAEVTLDDGDYDLQARLIDADRTVIERLVRVAVRGRTPITVVFTRSCAGVRCPGPSDPTEATACFAGRCVDPRCSPEMPERCAMPECTGDADCTTSVACAAAVCIAGACGEEFQDARCGPDEACLPEVGCGEPPPMPDAGTPDAGPRDGGTLARDAGGRDTGPPPIDGGRPDGGPSCTLVTLYRDDDGDGFGGAADDVCPGTAGYTDREGDCNDGDDRVHPGQRSYFRTAASHGFDYDCDGREQTEPLPAPEANCRYSTTMCSDDEACGSPGWNWPASPRCGAEIDEVACVCDLGEMTCDGAVTDTMFIGCR